jgi:hypothetical protein
MVKKLYLVKEVKDISIIKKMNKKIRRNKE